MNRRGFLAGVCASNGLPFSKDANGAPCLVKCVTGGGKEQSISTTIKRIDVCQDNCRRF